MYRFKTSKYRTRYCRPLSPLIQLGVLRGAASEAVTVCSPGRKEWRMSMGRGKMMVVLFSPDIELTANTVTLHT